MLFLIFIFGSVALTGLIKLLMAAYAPKAYEALVADEERRHQRRKSALTTGIGLAAKFMGK